MADVATSVGASEVVAHIEPDTPPTDVAAVIEEFGAAYEARDLERMLELFADDAELTAAVGTFRGKAQIRAFLAWDAKLSPTATCRDTGSGVIVSGRTAAVERIVALTYEGIPYEQPSVAIVDVDEQGRIVRYRSYYDKLALMEQIAARYPGIKGRLYRRSIGYLVAQGGKGLAVPSA